MTINEFAGFHGFGLGAFFRPRPMTTSDGAQFPHDEGPDCREKACVPIDESVKWDVKPEQKPPVLAESELQPRLL